MKHTSWNKFRLIFQTKFPIKYSIKILLNSDYSQKKKQAKKKKSNTFFEEELGLDVWFSVSS